MTAPYRALVTASRRAGDCHTHIPAATQEATGA